MDGASHAVGQAMSRASVYGALVIVLLIFCWVAIVAAPWICMVSGRASAVPAGMARATPGHSRWVLLAALWALPIGLCVVWAVYVATMPMLDELGVGRDRMPHLALAARHFLDAVAGPVGMLANAALAAASALAVTVAALWKRRPPAGG